MIELPWEIWGLVLVGSFMCFSFGVLTRYAIERNFLKYLWSMFVWKIKGSPVRSPEEIKEIFETYCYPCLHYDPELKECSSCECPVSPDHDKKNKLFYATESCPEGYFE